MGEFYFPFTFLSFPNIFIVSMNYFQVTNRSKVEINLTIKDANIDYTYVIQIQIFIIPHLWKSVHRLYWSLALLDKSVLKDGMCEYDKIEKGNIKANIYCLPCAKHYNQIYHAFFPLWVSHHNVPILWMRKLRLKG